MFLNLDKKTWMRIIIRVVLVAVGSFLVLYYGMPKKEPAKRKQTQTIMFTAMSTFFSAQLTTERPNYPFDHAL